MLSLRRLVVLLTTISTTLVGFANGLPQAASPSSTTTAAQGHTDSAVSSVASLTSTTVSSSAASGAATSTAVVVKPVSVPPPIEPIAGAVLAGISGPVPEPDIPTKFINGTYTHAIVLSIDGMHQTDLTYYVQNNPTSSFAALVNNGIQFTNATTSSPSDSFPGATAYITGATPSTSGVYYDAAYSRALYPPGSNCTGMPGTATAFDETIDLNSTALNGGGGFNMSALVMAKTAWGTCYPVLPHDFIKVNTIFEVARFAGYVTAYTDKHPAYEFANGPSGVGLSESYFPEINAVNGDLGTTEGYDALHWNALRNWTAGNHYNGTAWSLGGPQLYGGDFQSVSVAEKTYGYTSNGTIPSANLTQAISYTDQQLGMLISQLKTSGIYNSTLIIVSAKHGQSPKNKSLLKLVSNDALINATGVDVAGSSADDGAYLWLANGADAAKAKANLLANATSLGITQVWAGSAEVTSIGFGDPAVDDRAPDIVIKTNPGIIYASLTATKIAEHGGINPDDVEVPLIVHNPNIKAKTYDSRVSTRQIAPTLLQALGLDPAQLQSTVLDGTVSLPSVF